MRASSGDLKTAKPNLPLPLLIEIADRLFGAEGDPEALSSERDQNLALIDTDDRGFVLKISSAEQDLDHLAIQNDALRAVASYAIPIPAPRVIPSKAGNEIEFVDFDGQRHAVRLLTRLPGLSIARSGSSPVLRRAAGELAAHLDLATARLEGACCHDVIWDIRKAPSTRRHLPLLPGEEHRRLLSLVLQHAEARLLPALARLPTQWLHGDLNTNNILAAPAKDSITGIIDFGDMVKVPRVVDAAIVMTHLGAIEPDPMTAADEVVAAYEEVSRLSPAERDLLGGLMATRLTMAILVQLAHVEVHGAGHFDLSRHSRYCDVIERLALLDWQLFRNNSGRRSEGHK